MDTSIQRLELAVKAAVTALQFTGAKLHDLDMDTYADLLEEMSEELLAAWKNHYPEA